MNARRSRRPNRVNVQPRVAWLPVFGALTLCGLLFHLRLVQECRRLALDVGAAEQRLEQLRQIRLHEEARWAPMTTLAALRSAVRRFQLDMDWAGSDRTVYLVRTGPSPTTEPSTELYLARGVRVSHD